MAKEGFVVVGIGELLWDLFPGGKRLGGAPANFCFHGHQLGAAAYPVSAVGRDEPGRELRAALRAAEVPDAYLAADDRHPTGTVEVRLDRGKPSYTIHTDVAWDHIPMTPELEALAAKTDAVCFGSLAQRSEVSRATARAFLRAVPEGALKVFDVNLRQRFYTKEIVEGSLELADALKLSDEELPVLAAMFGLSGSAADQLEALRAAFDLRVVAYTRGPSGSLLLAEGESDDHPGCPGEAVNSVGAGDSFTAVLCMGLLNGRTLSDINAHANRVATFVCSQDGATPVLPRDLRTGLSDDPAGE